MRMHRPFILIQVLLIIGWLIPIGAMGQSSVSVDPPHWWVGMKQDTLHLLLRGDDLKGSEITIDYSGIKLIDQRDVQSSSYKLVDLLIGKNIKPGKIPININQNGQTHKIDYPLKPKKADAYLPKGLNQSDFIYLIMPDRFANGNPQNDEIEAMHQSTVKRDSAFYRHGGDLDGVIDHLDYLQGLGVTALWLNPFEENNQFHESYHGYAITDHYAVDPRLGDLESYKDLVKESHKKGIKIIRDVVYNHFGSEHYLIKDLPDSSWINHWEGYTRSNFRATTLLDPYASTYDRQRFSSGWFDHHMPDMNYSNKDLQHYMIQNSIWWVEEMQIDAYRIDTYAYPDVAFMQNWAQRLKQEYPSLFLFAETWVHGSAIQAWFAGGNRFGQGETRLDGVTDFQMYYAINHALKDPFSWTNGVAEIYYTLVDDVLYEHPENNVLFLDNHDLDRFFGSANQDFDTFKMGVGVLMTMRGIPSLLYGTEILMPYTGNHGIIRTDFPGGWPDDETNKFDSIQRLDRENEAFNYIAKLAKWRGTSHAISHGKLLHFVPENGVYVYFRYTEDELVMVVINQNETAKTLNLDTYREVLGMREIFYDVLSKKSTKSMTLLNLKPRAIHIFEVK